MELVLASASPRRQELLRQLGLRFRVAPADVPEELDRARPPAEAAVALALAKARHVAARFPDAVVLAADTIVVLGGDVLGKPVDAADALRMLTALAGRSHHVITGVAVVRRAVAQELSGYELTTVHFRPMPRDALERYVATGEPMDKAGAYGIQGRAATMVDRLEGDYFNVMGLPLARVTEMLERLGLRVL